MTHGHSGHACTYPVDIRAQISFTSLKPGYNGLIGDYVIFDWTGDGVLTASEIICFDFEVSGRTMIVKQASGTDHRQVQWGNVKTRS